VTAARVRWMARGEHEVPPGDAWLTPRERERAAAIRFTKRRTEYLLRRWTGKQAVAAAAGLSRDVPSLARVEVANGPTGAPVALVDGAPSGLEVSLTDRAGWAVCLVAAGDTRVGCDVEIVEPRSPGFVTDFLTPAEQRWLTSRADGDRDAAANLVWCAKESALKVLQTGLRRDTRSVEVVLTEPADRRDDEHAGWAPLEIRSSEGRRMPGWWRRDGVFLVTVASDLSIPPPAPLPGSADLTAATPVHSWLGQPLTS
jgi:4'-phosphopantetheinyl transferase